ncbi:hypothetical protein [Ostreibacterium oceani]|uniref:Uncharacterized protein n=1 Tax=Ostreibacterium oceani TaxID=2654998 RepID=A0A6N7EW46_9GAMM|nr:hypothetical protein [Ostreibacterium oceani]MPV85317.1 hypothetical protein [Ostreibacterium oceani]
MKRFAVLIFGILPFFSFAGKDYEFKYYDNFDTSVSSHQATNYGLNTELRQRQLYLDGINGGDWSRVSGKWYTSVAPNVSYSQVNHPYNRNSLSFFVEPNAVRLNKPISSGYNRNYNISFTVDPIKRDRFSSNWASFMLDDNRFGKGWVADSTVEFGFLITSDGGIQILERGNYHPNCRVPSSNTYKVNIDITNRLYNITVNGRRACSGYLSRSIPSATYAYLGSYITSASHVTSFDDFIIKTAASSNKKLKHYGYYFAEGNPFGSGTIGGALITKNFTNFNHVKDIYSLGSGYDAYRKCYPKKCILSTEWGHGQQAGISINDQLNQNIPGYSIKYKALFIALYAFDEPYWRDRDNTEIKARLKDLKEATGMPTMIVLSHPGLDSAPVNSNAILSPYLDYIGVNEYFSVGTPNTSTHYSYRLKKMTGKLKAKFPDIDNYYVVPAATKCLYAGAANSDPELAEITWGFHNYAAKNDISAVLAFTPWYKWPQGSGELNGSYCHNNAINNNDPRLNPITYRVMRILGKSIIED